MIRRPGDISIAPSSPFENDAFGREDEIRKLSSLVRRCDGPLVLAIDSPWGSGKTTFLRLWRAFLSGEGAASLLYNAWEADSAEDPLVSLMGEVGRAAEESSNAEGAKDAFNKTVQVAGRVGTN